MKKLLEISLDTMSGVFPFLKFKLDESTDISEVTVELSLIRLDGFESAASKETVLAFRENEARFLRLPLEADDKYMTFGYDSLIQLFVFLVCFFSVYLEISVSQVLNFFFNKTMNWKDFLQYVLESNLIESTIDNGAVFIYGIGSLRFSRHRFLWEDMHYNEFSYKITSDVEALFVLSFVLGYIQAVLGHDLMVSDLVDPDDDGQDSSGQPPEKEGMPPPGSDLDLGGGGAPPLGGAPGAGADMTGEGMGENGEPLPGDHPDVPDSAEPPPEEPAP